MSTSARTPVGAAQRAGLFSQGKDQPEGKYGDGDKSVGPGSPTSARNELQDIYGVKGADEDPLQLEHMLGFAGNFQKTVLCIPNDENAYVKRYISHKIIYL